MQDVALCWAIALLGLARAEEPAEFAIIEGRVTAPDGTPVSGADILLQSANAEPRWPGTIAKVEGDGVARTDERGRYRAAEIPPGRWYVAAIAEGYAVGEYGASTEWKVRFPLNLMAGERLTDIDLVLPWRWELSGRCLDADGAPVGGALVLTRFLLGTDGSCVGSAETLTDPSGRFASGPVPVGKGTRIEGPVRAKLSVSKWSGYGFEDREVGPIDVRPGAVHDVGDWRALRFCSLHGVVKRRDDRDFYGVHVRIFLEEAEVARDGTFRFERLAPGTAFLRIAPGVDGAASTPGPFVELAPGEEAGPILLTLDPPLTISGRVVDDRGLPVEWAQLQAFPANGGWMRVDEFPRARSGRDGHFEMRGVPPGEWIVVVDHHCPQRRRDPPPGSTVQVKAGADAVELTLSRPWTLRYRATARPDGTPAPSIRTHSVEDGPYGMLSMTGEDGGAILRFRDPVALEVQITFGERARWFGAVAPPARGATVDLGDFGFPVPEASRIEGTVVDPSGQPVRHPRVHAIHLATGVLVDDLDDANFGDVRGRFAIERLAAGDYALLAVTPGHAHALLPRVTVDRAATTRVKLQCRSPEPLALRVVDPEGKPIERARIQYRLDGFEYWFERDYRTYQPRSHGHDWTDADGWIRRPLMPAGGMDLKVLAKGYQTWSLRLEPGDARSIVVRLAK